MTSHTRDIEAICDRLEKLERQSRRRKLFGLVGLLLASAVLVMAPARSVGVLEAQKLVIRYPGGGEAIVLSIDDNEAIKGPQIKILDRQNKPVISLAATYLGPSLNLTAPDLSSGLVLSMARNYANRVFVGYSSSLHFLRVEKTGSRSLLRLDGSESGSYVYLYGQGGTPQARLSNDRDGPRVELYDHPDKLRAALGTTPLENIRTGSVEVRSPASLVLFDRDNKVIWRAP